MTDLKSLLVRALSDARAAGSDDEQTANLLMARMEAAGVEVVKSGQVVESIARADVDRHEQLVERVLSAEAENERLREALKQVEKKTERTLPSRRISPLTAQTLGSIAEIARAALKETSHD